MLNWLCLFCSGLSLSRAQANGLRHPSLLRAQRSGGQRVSPALLRVSGDRRLVLRGAVSGGVRLRPERRTAHLHDHHGSGVAAAAGITQPYVQYSSSLNASERVLTAVFSLLMQWSASTVSGTMQVIIKYHALLIWLLWQENKQW